MTTEWVRQLRAAGLDPDDFVEVARGELRPAEKGSSAVALEAEASTPTDPLKWEQHPGSGLLQAVLTSRRLDNTSLLILDPPDAEVRPLGGRVFRFPRSVAVQAEGDEPAAFLVDPGGACMLFEIDPKTRSWTLLRASADDEDDDEVDVDDWLRGWTVEGWLEALLDEPLWGPDLLELPVHAGHVLRYWEPDSAEDARRVLRSLTGAGAEATPPISAARWVSRWSPALWQAAMHEAVELADELGRILEGQLDPDVDTGLDHTLEVLKAAVSERDALESFRVALIAAGQDPAPLDASLLSVDEAGDDLAPFLVDFPLGLTEPRARRAAEELPDAWWVRATPSTSA